MPLACPHCREPIDSSSPPPTSCVHCGGELPRVGGASDITIDYSPRHAGGDSGTLAATARIAAQEQGRRFGEYHLLRLLGEGGMGVVWEAEQAETGRRVALKLISPSLQPTPETVDRFLREGQLAASVSHPRSTFVFGAGEQDGQPYIAMELMPGETLKDLLDREGPLPVERAVDSILDVIEGLEAAHLQGVIHRDVKPSNCFIDSDGRVKVGDFGLSKSLVSDAELTRTGAFLGTPQFAAPEQVRGAAATPATDVYAAGATLFCLLTGRGPFVGDALAVVAQITSDPAPPLRHLRPDAPRALERIIARTLEKNPARRFADLAQLRQALAPFATGGASIADVGRRFAAYMLDEFAVAFVVVSSTAVGSIVIAFQAARASETADVYSPTVNAWLQIVQAGMGVAYFALAEARWGRGLGKLLMGLRVIGPHGDRPEYGRSLLRSAFVPGALGLCVASPVLALLRATEAPAWTPPVREWLVSLLPMGFALLCLITMRARNGYRGLHELISGTRVIRVQRIAASRRRRLPIIAPTAADESISFGPFRWMGDLGKSGLLNVRQARDDLLNRPVWIYDGLGELPGFSAARRAVARPARLHWLQGGQSREQRWDAFEAATGAPLADVARGGGADWHQGRWWVLALAEELAAAASDNTLPPSLSLDQVWINRSGHVKLLDAPVQPIRSDVAANGSLVGPVSAGAGAVALLREAVGLCTRAQLLPSHVRAFADELAARPANLETLDWAVKRLREVSRQPTALGWDDRLGVLAVTMGTEMSAYMGAAFGLVYLAASMLHGAAPLVATAATAIAAWLLPAIVAFAFRGGPAFWLTRIEVLRADGRRAGRWRCAWRNLVAWTALTLPYATMGMLVGPLLQSSGQAAAGQPPNLTFNPDEQTTWIFVGGICAAELLGALFCLGVIYALARPRRGIQDVLAGTYLMPR